MKLSNKTYDFLKWFALIALPATQVFWLTIGKVWNFPYLTEVGATIGALGLFIAALLGLSNKNFAEGAMIYDTDEPLEDGDEEIEELEEPLEDQDND